MSLEIDVEKISEVLLADGWHKVTAVGDGRSSFGIDVYDFRDPKADANTSAEAPTDRQVKDGQEQGNGARGARWTESDGSRVFCPVTSILAVKYAGQNKSEGGTNSPAK
jgi:hypothetical protein